MKLSNFTSSVVGCSLARLVRKFFERSAVSFWKIEAREWRRLYQEQRGGEAFDSIQRQLADARAEIDGLKRDIANAEVSDGGPLTHESPAAQSRRSLH